ncbi:MAG: O-methyltransferase [Bacteroidota bacterium]
MFDIVSPAIQQYCEDHTQPESAVLQKLSRHTFANVLQPRMLSGHFQGRLLSLFSNMIRPKYILEIGTYTGYSAICLAEGLQEGGMLITIDIDPEHEENIHAFIDEAGMSDKIRFIVGDAYNIIKTLPYKFDLVFIDADKPNYLKYYEQAIDCLNDGGYFIADNVLWSGKVVDEKSMARDKDTRILHEFNERVHNDDRVEHLLLPLRDGLMMGKKMPKIR